MSETLKKQLDAAKRAQAIKAARVRRNIVRQPKPVDYQIGRAS